jgi:putative Holliday junction resolvase
VGRILAFDFGKKRTGVAATDPLQIIASGLKTVDTQDVFKFITEYLKTEQVDLFVVGFPTQFDNSKPSHSAPLIENFVKQLKKKFPNIPVDLEDEHYTSKLAVQAMIDGGLKKMQRRDKAMIDKVSASIILQSYMSRTKK